MPPVLYEELFSADYLRKILPEDRADHFFEALLGDPEEGSFDIRLVFEGKEGHCLRFAFHLQERPGKCLTCSRTYGLPEVFKRHPVINLLGIIDQIHQTLNGSHRIDRWQLERTREIAKGLHAIPLLIQVEPLTT
jgi:hypothetical protein